MTKYKSNLIGTCCLVVGSLILLLAVGWQCQSASLGTSATPAAPPDRVAQETVAPGEDQPPANVAPPPGVPDPSDLLAVVRARGVLRVGLRVWPEATFVPPAFRDPAGGALTGFEVGLARALADALQVELELVPVDPQTLRAGGWGGEWDLALASLPITDNARQLLNFSDPYIYLPVGVLVRADNDRLTDLASLREQTLGVPFETTIESVLRGELISVEGRPLLERLPDNLVVEAYPNDAQAIRDLAAGNEGGLDGVVHFLPLLRVATDFDLPVKLATENIFLEPIGVAFDRQGPPSGQLLEAVNATLAAMRTDGTLAELSLAWYGQDYSVLP